MNIYTLSEAILNHVGVSNVGMEDTTSLVIKMLLFIGAIFQIYCLGACIFITESPNDTSWGPRESEDDSSESSSPQTTPRRPHYRTIRKPEKKKRR